MKNRVESLLEADHQSLSNLLTQLDQEMRQSNIPRAFELLDLFWARLAVHIRAENLHLFPALANVPAMSFTGEGGVPTYEQAHNVLDRLRSDHDFFMKELAQMIKVMREIAGSQPSHIEELEDMRQRLADIKDRLDQHNRLEEGQVYLWPSLVFDEQMVTGLCEGLRQELENLPPRFG